MGAIGTGAPSLGQGDEAVARGTVERRLAAILVADVAGYSRLVGADEEATLAGLKAHREALVDPVISEHGGRIVKTTGDGVLAEFPSAVSAVRCAVRIQRGMSERNAGVSQHDRIEFRIGINVGDVVVDAGDILGDGVNVAARLEALARPGGVCISDRVREDAEGRLDVGFDDMGEQRLKNIARPVRVHRLMLDRAPDRTPSLALPDKPSVAVLPFQNMSGDAEQEYFADGMVEEITTALSKFRHLFIIARNSAFTFKGRVVDVRDVGRELGVRYVLEGSVCKAAGRLRITAQLLDAATATHIWADRFDGALADIFELQDLVAESVVSAVAPRLDQAEIDRAIHKPTGSLDAYDYYLRGLAVLNRGSLDVDGEALKLFGHAIERDPGFAAAYALAAYCYVWRRANGWMVDRTRETAESERLAHRAVELGRDDAGVVCWAGFALARVVGDLEGGLMLIDRAMSLNPNLAAAWNFSGRVLVYAGEHELAIRHLAHAMRLSPLDPLLFGMLGAMAFAHFFAGRHEEACAWAEKAMHENPNFLPVTGIAAASNASAGRMPEARNAVERLRAIDPRLRVASLSDHTPIRRAQDLAKYAGALRLAGLAD